jgi:hypothetical protein
VSALEETIAAGGEPDEVLRNVVAGLVDSGATWAGILFVESGELVLGPEAGTPAGNALGVPVLYDGSPVAELAAEGADPELLERIAGLIGEHCLVGWDTGGEAWEP